MIPQTAIGESQQRAAAIGDDVRFLITITDRLVKRSTRRRVATSTNLIAIVDAFNYPNAESDLASYRSQFGLPA